MSLLVEQAVRDKVCIPKPEGCGKPINDFRDELSFVEYKISGLCQACQIRYYNQDNKPL